VDNDLYLFIFGCVIVV